MPLKEDIIEQIQNDGKVYYTQKEVKHLIHEVKTNGLFELQPVKIKRGDIIRENLSGGKLRPSLVIGVYKEYCVIVGMSTTKDHRYLCNVNSRFDKWNESYINCDLSIVSHEYVNDKVVGIYDNDEYIKYIRKLLKNKYKFL